MARCYWEMKIVRGSSMLTLICDLSAEEFSTARKMNLLYEAASELSEIFLSQDISCFIGVGPVGENIQQEKKWQLVLIPEENEELKSPERERRKKALLTVMLEFLKHLNQTPEHYLPTVKNKDKNTDLSLN